MSSCDSSDVRAVYEACVCVSVCLYGGVLPAGFYRDHVSRFDVEAGQVVVVAIIFKGANLQGRRSIWRTRTGGKIETFGSAL